MDPLTFKNCKEQGCILVPCLFDVLFDAICLDTSDLKAGSFLQDRNDAWLLNLVRLRPKVSSATIHKLRPGAAKSFGLTISLEKI